MFDQVKQFIKSYESELILALGVILISLVSFAAGRLTAPGIEKQAILFEELAPTPAVAAANSAFQNITNAKNLQETGKKISGKFVASKNSNKYHLSTCIGARRIAEHNKIWFNSKEEAESMGYTPASNCPGM